MSDSKPKKPQGTKHKTKAAAKAVDTKKTESKKKGKTLPNF